MNARAILPVLIVLAGCGGGASVAPPATAITTTAPVANSATQRVPTSFAVGLPATSAAASKRKPNYLGSGAVSVEIALNTVNGTAPSGLIAAVISSITPASCPCTVAGPLVPPGSDSFTFTTFDGANAQGNVLATYTGTFTIASGAANAANTVTLLGVPALLGIEDPPEAAPNNPYSVSHYNYTVEDADRNEIVGAFASPVTVSVADTFGSLGVQLAVNGGTPSSSVTLTQSTDTLSYLYGGITDDPSITISAPGAATVTAPGAAAASNITYSGPRNAANAPEIDLYAPSGAGSQASFSVSEAGWTNSPYTMPVTATPSGCASIGTISPASGTSFTFTAVAAPVPGSCTITLQGGYGNTVSVTATYTTSGFGVN